jgi:hypothetical protein
METELTLLAQNAGTTLVTLMATDAWQRMNEGITQLWRRIQPQRAETIAAELAADREEALAAVEAGDEETLHELRAQWQGRLRRFLVAQPSALEDVRCLLDEFTPPGAPAAGNIVQRASASGRARIYQAGRDQYITER